MAFFVSAPKGGEWTPAPQGNHQGVCIDVVDLGVEEKEWSGKVTFKHKCRLIWEIDEINPDNDVRYSVSRKFTVSLHRNSNLRAVLKAWRGRDFTDAELERFDLEQVIGANCMLNVVHNESGDRTYANVETVTPLPKGLKPIKPGTSYVRMKDRDDWTEPSHDVPADRRSSAEKSNGEQIVEAAAMVEDALPF